MFRLHGYEIVPGILDAARCNELIGMLPSDSSQVGDRNLLPVPAVQRLARQLIAHPLLNGLLPPKPAAIQCTLFDKSRDKNWLVALHQDLSIPVAARIEDPSCTGWSIKGGVYYTQPPVEVLQALIAVRIHLDDCSNDNGPLRVVAGSHRRGRWTAAEIDGARLTLGEVECPVPLGGALVMSPLLLHASSKAKRPGHRRVLHFLLGPQELPCKLRWHYSVCNT